MRSSAQEELLLAIEAVMSFRFGENATQRPRDITSVLVDPRHLKRFIWSNSQLLRLSDALSTVDFIVDNVSVLAKQWVAKLAIDFLCCLIPLNS